MTFFVLCTFFSEHFVFNINMGDANFTILIVMLGIGKPL